MRLRTVSVALLWALLAAPVTVLAQYSATQASNGPDNYLTGYYNFNFGGDIFKNRETDTTANGFGGALTFWGRGKFSAELDFNYNKNFFGTSENVGENNLLTFTLGGIIGPWARAGSGRVRPYFAFGGGLMRSTLKDFATVGWTDTKNLGLIEAGGGLLWLFNDTVGIRADARYRWGVGANSDEAGWGLIEKWTYVRATVGLALAF
jgi:hypothetical protein